MSNIISKVFLAAALGGICVGCNQSVSTPKPAASSGNRPSSDKLIAERPANAQPVGDVRESAEDGAEVTILGRIGGGSNPWVNGRAAFTIIDPKVPPCHPSEGCPTPWDYCCQTDQLPANRALIKFVTASGETVEEDARQMLGVKELQTVVVKGKAKRDDAGNLTVVADRIYVAPAEQ